MRPIAIIDIDTTIANNDHRAALLQRVCVDCGKDMTGTHGQDKWPTCECGGVKYAAPQSAWDAFLSPELMLKDTPQPHALDVIEKMRPGFQIVFMTGRNEKHREVTEQWLRTHMCWRSDTELLIMRPHDDKGTPASQMKEKMFLKLRDTVSDNWGFHPPFFFFEDDRFVLGTWQKYGTVFLCPHVWELMNPTTHERVIEPSWNR